MSYGDARFLGPKDTTSLAKRLSILRAAKKGDYNSIAIIGNTIDDRICSVDIGDKKCEDMPSGNKGCNQYFYREGGVGYTCRNNSAGTKCQSGSNSFFGTKKMTCKKKVESLVQREQLKANARLKLVATGKDGYTAPSGQEWFDSSIEPIDDDPLVVAAQAAADDEGDAPGGGGRKSRRKKRGKGHKRTARKKHRRPKGRGLMQSRPRRGDAPPRAAAVAHRRRVPLTSTLHGKVPPPLQRDLLETGVVVYGPSVGTRSERTAAVEEAAEEKSARRGLGLHRRADAREADTQRAFIGLERTSSGSSTSSLSSAESRPHGRRRPWNPLDSYNTPPSAKSPGASPGSRRAARGRNKRTRRRGKRARRTRKR